jgi:anaerobic magnesium-protoporphyrin IX monomethyl ester cyclase
MESQLMHKVKALLFTVPLDLGVPRDATEALVIPKIAIVSLIKWMERNGYTKDEYDFYDIDMLEPSDEQIINYLKECQPTLVGLSATVSTTYMSVRRLAALVRQACPNAWVVCGGGLAVSANVLLNKTEVDMCIQSDGEIPWTELCNYTKQHGLTWNFEELAKIKGLTYLDNDGALIFNGYPDKLPSSDRVYPDYDVLKIGLRTKPETFKNYFREGPKNPWFVCDYRTFEPHRRPMMACLWTTKGCVARCTFCQRSTKGYVTNEVTTLDEHLRILKEEYNVGFIQLSDENFGSDKKHAYEVARTMKKHDMLWFAGGVRCVSVEYEDAKFYQDHGCSALKFGVESGSQKILDLMEKRFTVQQVFTAVSHCIKLGLYSPLAVMTGMPGETDETATETGKYLGTIARMQGTPPSEMGIAVFYALPLPGTPLYQYGQQFGKIGKSVDDEEKYLIAISDCPSSKANYINLNGNSLRKLLFWDFLIYAEATRTYYSKPLGNDFIKHIKSNFEGLVNKAVHGEQDEAEYNLVKYGDPKEKQNEIVQAANQKYANFLNISSHWHFLKGYFINMDNKKKLRFLAVYLLTRWATHVDTALAYSKRAQKLPRWLLYPIMREMIYQQFVWYGVVRRVVKAMGKPVHPRNLFDFNDIVPKPISDADVNKYEQRIQRSLRNVVAINRAQNFKPANNTEFNQELLHQGR